ncbi:MAG TPA: EAL domain-containing protein, partial [Thermomicrobiales bacterium]|nr:EAL domain-containing protein [Thermomicrobiales bacterium]
MLADLDLAIRDPARLAALRDLAVLDTPPEEAFDRLTRLAARLLHAPVAAIALADEARLFVKSQVGLPEPWASRREVPLARSFGRYVVASGEPLVVADAATHPLVRDEPALRARGPAAYAGVPLVAAGGLVLGVLSAADGRPRAWTAEQIATLADLAAAATTELDLRAAARAATRQAAALRESEARLRDFLDNASDLVQTVAPDGRFLSVNRAWRETLGYDEDDLAALTLFDVLHPEHREEARQWFALLLRGDRLPHVETVFIARDGRPVAVTGNAICRFEVGRPVAVRGIFRDVTAHRTLERQLEHQASHDPLSGLPNRALYMDRLAAALARAVGARHACAALLLDLDGFKHLNDSLGHDHGDRLLVSIARRLRRCLRGEDTVARLGGDEFAILLEEVGDLSEALRVAERVAAALRVPVQLGEQEVFAGASIGIALSSSADDRPEDLLRFADVAMYRAKEAGKGCYEVFYPGMHEQALERLRVETDLRRGLEREEFRVHYQPIVAVESSRIVEVEALLRWEHPERGLVPPGEFIPLAEETGLIVPLGRWVLREACRQGRRWQERWPDGPPLTIAVNLSAQEFQHPDVAQEVAQALAETGLDPRHLRLEITESAMMAAPETVIAVQRELKALGVQLVIDDFGTGYSSLAYLQRFPVDGLKIDRSFLRDAQGNPTGLKICRAIATLAQTLNLEVTAEGIETDQQAALLRTFLCDRAQGYYYARPLPAPAVTELLGRGEALGVR